MPDFKRALRSGPRSRPLETEQHISPARFDGSLLQPRLTVWNSTKLIWNRPWQFNLGTTSTFFFLYFLPSWFLLSLFVPTGGLALFITPALGCAHTQSCKCTVKYAEMFSSWLLCKRISWRLGPSPSLFYHTGIQITSFTVVRPTNNMLYAAVSTMTLKVSIALSITLPTC